MSHEGYYQTAFAVMVAIGIFALFFVFWLFTEWDFKRKGVPTK
jgi:hypothetical protein